MSETKRTILERIDARLTLVEDQQGQLLANQAQLLANQARLLVIGNNITQGVIMANQALEALTTQINDATNAVAARIDRLTTSLQDVATPEQLAELGAISAHLTTLGQDPANPVPTPPSVAG